VIIVIYKLLKRRYYFNKSCHFVQYVCIIDKYLHIEYISHTSKEKEYVFNTEYFHKYGSTDAASQETVSGLPQQYDQDSKASELLRSSRRTWLLTGTRLPGGDENRSSS